MAKRNSLLLATGDPALEAGALQATGCRIIATACETPTDCLSQAAVHQPDGILLSQALAPWPGQLAALIRELRSLLPETDLLVTGALHPGDDPLTGATLLPESVPLHHCIEVWARTGTPPGPARLAKREPMGEITIFPPPIHPNDLPPAVGQGTDGRAARDDSGAPQAPSGWAWQRLLTRSAEPSTSEQAPAPAPGPPLIKLDSAAVLRQKVVACWGGKPGAGRSTLLLAVADVISRLPGVRVCTVDLNLHNSSLAALLRLEGRPGSWSVLGDTLQSQRLTAKTLTESLFEIQPQWALLTGPAGSDLWTQALTPAVVSDLIDLLRSAFDYILLDLGASRSPVTDAALREAQQVLVVVSSFFPDVADTTAALDRAVADGLLTRERCRLVLSQWVDSMELPADDVGACLGMPVAARIPLAPSGALMAARLGRPVTQLETPEAKALADGAIAVAGLIVERGLAKPQRRGWFGR